MGFCRRLRQGGQGTVPAAWVSEASYYLWKSKFGGMSVPEARRLKELEIENARLKSLLAETMLEAEVAKEVLRRKW